MTKTQFQLEKLLIYIIESRGRSSFRLFAGAQTTLPGFFLLLILLWFSLGELFAWGSLRSLVSKTTGFASSYCVYRWRFQIFKKWLGIRFLAHLPNPGPSTVSRVRYSDWLDWISWLNVWHVWQSPGGQRGSSQMEGKESNAQRERKGSQLWKTHRALPLGRGGRGSKRKGGPTRTTKT